MVRWPMARAATYVSLALVSSLLVAHVGVLKASSKHANLSLGKCRGYGFLTLVDQEKADATRRAIVANKLRMHDREVNVSWADKEAEIGQKVCVYVCTGSNGGFVY